MELCEVVPAVSYPGSFFATGDPASGPPVAGSAGAVAARSWWVFPAAPEAHAIAAAGRDNGSPRSRPPIHTPPRYCWPGRDAGFAAPLDRTGCDGAPPNLSLIHISEPTRLGMISYAVFCL